MLEDETLSSVNQPNAEQSPSDDAVSNRDQKPVLHFWRCFWLTFLVVSLAYAWHCFYVPANEIAWAKDFSSAQRLASDSDKPMILYFTGQWCVPCRVMKRQVWADEEVAELVNAQYVPVAIDVDDPGDASVLKRYNVGGAPVTIVCDHEGNALRWRVGGIGKSEFLELVQQTEASAPVNF